MGPDDLVSIPAFDGTVKCNKFLCFNLDIGKKNVLARGGWRILPTEREGRRGITYISGRGFEICFEINTVLRKKICSSANRSSKF